MDIAAQDRIRPHRGLRLDLDIANDDSRLIDPCIGRYARLEPLITPYIGHRAILSPLKVIDHWLNATMTVGERPGFPTAACDAHALSCP
ncbi:MAG: hypothetical protein ACOC26_01515 [Halochromatium sp.]